MVVSKISDVVYLAYIFIAKCSQRTRRDISCRFFCVVENLLLDEDQGDQRDRQQEGKVDSLPHLALCLSWSDVNHVGALFFLCCSNAS